MISPSIFFNELEAGVPCVAVVLKISTKLGIQYCLELLVLSLEI